MAIPGMRGMEHIGFTVPNLEEATRFLVDVLGCEQFYTIGPFAADDAWMARQMNVPAGAVMLSFGTSPRLPHAADLWMLGCAVAAGVVGYAAMVLATRRGEMSVIAPFRYSRLVFAMALGWLAFDERPDRAMLAGAAMIVGSGLYSFARERRRALSSARHKG